jgi:hypothetical protein
MFSMIVWLLALTASLTLTTSMVDQKDVFPTTIQGCWVAGSPLTGAVQDPSVIGCLFIFSEDSVFIIRHNEDSFSLVNCRKITSAFKEVGTILVLCEHLDCADTDLADFSIKIANLADAASLNRTGIECIQFELKVSGKKSRSQDLSEKVAQLYQLDNQDALRRIENALTIGTSKTAYSAKNSIWLAKYLKKLRAIVKEEQQ